MAAKWNPAATPARCIARLLMDESGLAVVRLETPRRHADLQRCGGQCRHGRYGRAASGLAGDSPCRRPSTPTEFAMTAEGRDFLATAVSVGNPHCVLFVADAASRRRGRDRSPARTSSPVSPTHQRRIRPGDCRARGCACGCGNAASASRAPAEPAPAPPPWRPHAAVSRRARSRSFSTAEQLAIEWRESDGHVLMTGPSR